MNDVRDEDLERVSPSALEAYLRRREEWHRAGSMADEVGTFYELMDGNEAVVVPASSTFADYSVRMAENVAVLAAHEDRERAYVLEDLLAAHDDVVRVSVGTSKSRPSLALADGSALLETSRKLLVAAARSAEQAEWAHVGRAGKHVEEYLRSVRFGHTERGSLVFPIYSPVEDGMDVMGDEEVPLGRRAVETLVSALEALQNVTRARSGVLNQSELSDAESVKLGVSANLCSALSSLIEIGQGVGLSVSWALTHAAPRTTDFRVRFRPQDKEKLDEMASRLSSADDWSSIIDARGPVLGLNWDREKQRRSAKVRVSVNGKRRTLVLRNLPRTEYERVLEAHRRGRDVEFSGMLRREDRPGRLQYVEKVRVLDSDA